MLREVHGFLTYSKGNRQKVALVAALAGDAELYLLGQPTSGLDPLLRRTSVTAHLAAPPVGLERLEGVHDLRIDGTDVSAQVDTAGVSAFVGALATIGIESMVSPPPTLVKLFLRHNRRGAA